MKKSKKSKSPKSKITKSTKLEIRTAEQKSNRLYGIIGMVALFLVGVIFGYVINGSDHVNRSTMTESQCKELASDIGHLIRNNRYEELKIANEIYSENCLDRDFGRPKLQPQPKMQERKLPDTTCGKIESLLTGRLYKADNPDAEAHIDNAKIYANLSERGCPENSEKYKVLAKQELEIARALNDDNLKDREDSIEIVETYKRLQMQAEAERMIEKAKKLTNPAIDFIIQLEKIIEE